MTELYIGYFSIIILGLINIYCLIHINKHKLLLFLLIPFIIFNCFYVLKLIESYKGTAISNIYNQPMQIITYEKYGNYIYFIAYNENREQVLLYKLENNKENREQIQGIEKKLEQNENSVGKFIIDNTTEEVDFVLKDFDIPEKKENN